MVCGVCGIFVVCCVFVVVGVGDVVDVGLKKANEKEWSTVSECVFCFLFSACCGGQI